ncbi:hypothetical protein DMUE_3625 [Dictyocoela muelleri]|nr:hypothetical protein DMUE_3625 [Dictyocoela muelleri]
MWYCDGTFYSGSREFSKLNVLLSDIYNIVVLLLYIFINIRSKNSYTRAFNFLKEKIHDKYPSFITIDFETASFVSFKEVFPDSKVNGCFFHISQLLFNRFRSYETLISIIII